MAAFGVVLSLVAVPIPESVVAASENCMRDGLCSSALLAAYEKLGPVLAASREISPTLIVERRTDANR